MIARIEDETELAELFIVENPAHETRIREILRRSRPVLRGHFALQAGDHSNYFLRFTQIGREAEHVDALAQMLLSDDAKTKESNLVLVPESAGFFLGASVARSLGAALAVAQIDDLRCPRKALRHGAIAQGDRVLLVNDVITTGKSLEPLLQLVRDCGAAVARILTFACTDPKRARLFRNKIGVDVRWLATCAWSTNKPEVCEGCRRREVLLPATEFN
jgi:orotate phosphoribosyltransferase